VFLPRGPFENVLGCNFLQAQNHAGVANNIRALYPLTGYNRKMPKYGIFNDGEKAPHLTLDGDSMLQHGEFLEIFSGKEDEAKVVAAIRLEEGQRVQEI